MRCKFTILVSSSDGYEDCWIPFFSLFKKYWPECDAPIILNTNSKEFSFPGLNIVCPAVSKRYKKNYKWGARLKRSLEFIEDDIILFMLDDYFVQSPVVEEKIYEFVELMKCNNLSHIMLYPEPGPNHKSKYPALVERGQKAEYRFSFQVGLWRKERLSFYLRDHEDPWHAERWGTRRSWKIKDSFYCIDKSYFEKNGPIIDYHKTGGIIGGKWSKEKVTDLFRDNNIETDFSKRGFYDKNEQRTLSQRIRNRIIKLPIGLKSMLDLWLLRAQPPSDSPL